MTLPRMNIARLSENAQIIIPTPYSKPPSDTTFRLDQRSAKGPAGRVKRAIAKVNYPSAMS